MTLNRLPDHSSDAASDRGHCPHDGYSGEDFRQYLANLVHAPLIEALVTGQLEQAFRILAAHNAVGLPNLVPPPTSPS